MVGFSGDIVHRWLISCSSVCNAETLMFPTGKTLKVLLFLKAVLAIRSWSSVCSTESCFIFINKAYFTEIFTSTEKPDLFFKRNEVLTIAKSKRHFLLKKTGLQSQNFCVVYEISEK